VRPLSKEIVIEGNPLPARISRIVHRASTFFTDSKLTLIKGYIVLSSGLVSGYQMVKVDLTSNLQSVTSLYLLFM
jgi:hypothetical protein